MRNIKIAINNLWGVFRNLAKVLAPRVLLFFKARIRASVKEKIAVSDPENIADRIISTARIKREVIDIKQL